MSSKSRGWTRHFAVLGGFEMVFAGVAAVGIFLTAAGLGGFTNGAVAIALTAALLLVTGFVLLRTSSHRGSLLDARQTKMRRLLYRSRYR
jgi:hypothetical protein